MLKIMVNSVEAKDRESVLAILEEVAEQPEAKSGWASRLLEDTIQDIKSYDCKKREA